MRSDMPSHLLEGAWGHADKATPAVPDPCLDHFLSDATIAFCFISNFELLRMKIIFGLCSVK